jgi:hypothetical protein
VRYTKLEPRAGDITDSVNFAGSQNIKFSPKGHYVLTNDYAVYDTSSRPDITLSRDVACSLYLTICLW